MKNFFKKGCVYIFLALVIFLIAINIVLAILNLLGFKFNRSPSIPYGLYKISNKPIKRNNYVIFCPPDTEPFRLAKKRNYIPIGGCPNHYTALMKVVIGIPGDTYKFTYSGLILNNQLQKNTKPLFEDRLLRKLPIFISEGILKKVEYILMGTTIPNSYDARYYGLINKENIISSIDPIWTD